MMRMIFLDTSYLLALIRKKDARHEAALTASANHTGPFITTDLVLVEFANCLSQPPYRATAVAIIEKIRSDRNTRVVSFDSGGMEKAFTLYKGRPDKARALHNCIKPTILSFPRRRESSIINGFLDTGLRRYDD